MAPTIREDQPAAKLRAYALLASIRVLRCGPILRSYACEDLAEVVGQRFRKRYHSLQPNKLLRQIGSRAKRPGRAMRNCTHEPFRCRPTPAAAAATYRLGSTTTSRLGLVARRFVMTAARDGCP